MEPNLSNQKSMEVSRFKDTESAGYLSLKFDFTADLNGFSTGTIVGKKYTHTNIAANYRIKI